MLPLDRAIGSDCQLGLLDLGSLTLACVGASIGELKSLEPTVLVSTPTDALRLGHRATSAAHAAVRLVVVTGEPGGSIGATRRAIESRWGAQCFDVYGLTELGVIGWGCPRRTGGIHLNDRELLVENAASSNTLAELVVTTPDYWGTPLAHFATGDLVRVARSECACGRSGVWLEDGVLGRVNERLMVRDHDLLPSSIEQVVRRHPAVVDFRLQTYERRGHSQITVALEPDDAIGSESDRARVAAEVGEDLKRSIGVRLLCDVVSPGSYADDQDAGRRARRLRRQ
jgi:phenylacetate-CoA ligase